MTIKHLAKCDMPKLFAALMIKLVRNFFVMSAILNREIIYFFQNTAVIMAFGRVAGGYLVNGNGATENYHYIFNWTTCGRSILRVRDLGQQCRVFRGLFSGWTLIYTL